MSCCSSKQQFQGGWVLWEPFFSQLFVSFWGVWNDAIGTVVASLCQQLKCATGYGMGHIAKITQGGKLSTMMHTPSIVATDSIPLHNCVPKRVPKDVSCDSIGWSILWFTSNISSTDINKRNMKYKPYSVGSRKQVEKQC